MKFKEYKLGNVLELKNGKKRTKEFGCYPVYGGNGILGYENEFNVEGYTLIIGRVGAYCGSLYQHKGKCWVSDNAIIAKIKKEFNKDYIYYLLSNINLNKLHIGSSHPLLTQDILNNISVKIPTLETQNKTSKILAAIDYKIELNNQMKDNLQQLSQELYKRWFIDFEFPDEDGNPYKSSGGKMIDSELGQIPEGWETLNAKDYLEFERGIEPGSKNYSDNKTDKSLRFYRVGDMLSGNAIYVNKSLLKNKSLSPGDIAVSFDGTVGRIAIDLCGSYSTGIRKIYSKKESVNLYNAFLYEYFKSDYVQSLIIQNSRGTTIMHASSSIEMFKIIYNKEIFEKAQNMFENNFKMFLDISKENNLLSKLRDVLLPRLLNGEINLDNVEV